jgi:hypothetical protein
MVMVHSSTELLIDYWRSRRGGRPSPLRADIDPTGFAPLAPRAFVAVREIADIRFRLAGEAVIELARRPLAGASMLALWRPEHRGRVAALASAALIAGEPVVIEGVCGPGPGLELRLEMLLAPLVGPEGVADRFVGLCQPLDGARVAPMVELSIAAVNGHAAERSHLRLAALDGRRIA